jgi:nicotinamidase-related amidase
MGSIEQFEDHCWQDVIPDADRKLYSKYARATFVGPKPALLAVDLYNAVYKGGPRRPDDIDAMFSNSCGLFAHRAIGPTRRLFAEARAAGIPVFYSTHDDLPNGRPTLARSTRRITAERPHEEYEIYPDFAPQQGDIVIRKQRASAFHGTPLNSHLATLGVRSLIVCGEATSGCVRATAVDGYSNGLHVSIVEECTFDRVELSHKVNLWDMHHKYLDVMHLEEVLDHLRAMRTEIAGTELRNHSEPQRGVG